MMEIAEKYLTGVTDLNGERYGVYKVIMADGRQDMMFQRMSLKDYVLFRVRRWWLDLTA